MPPQLLLDLTPLAATSALRGIGRYVRGLVQGLTDVWHESSPNFEIRGLAANRSLTALHRIDDLAAYCALPAARPPAAADARRNWLITFAAPLSLRNSNTSLHLTDPKGMPIGRASRYTVTCHDIISLALPDLYLPPIPRWSRLVRQIERSRYLRARRILAVSQATRRDLVTVLGIPEDRIDVAWHGVDHARFNVHAQPEDAQRVHAALGATEPYVLYVGAGDARKDLDTLLTAYAASRVQREALLVVAGRLSGQRSQALRQLAKRLNVLNRVKLVGYLDEAIVPALYRRSRLHVFPSLYEGFGLPVIEALACGAPTITSPGSSLDEVAGDAARIVPCRDTEAMSHALEEVFYDEATRTLLRNRGLRRAKQFTWQACAEATLAFWRRSL